MKKKDFTKALETIKRLDDEQSEMSLTLNRVGIDIVNSALMEGELMSLTVHILALNFEKVDEVEDFIGWWLWEDVEKIITETLDNRKTTWHVAKPKDFATYIYENYSLK